MQENLYFFVKIILYFRHTAYISHLSKAPATVETTEKFKLRAKKTYKSVAEHKGYASATWKIAVFTIF